MGHVDLICRLLSINMPTALQCLQRTVYISFFYFLIKTIDTFHGTGKNHLCMCMSKNGDYIYWVVLDMDATLGVFGKDA